MAATAGTTEVPEYVVEHAPLLYLYSSDPYRPSSIAAQLADTHPEIDAKPIEVPQSPLTLENLDQLNNLGANAGKDVYITSNDNITTNPKWLEGTQPDTKGGTGDEKTSVIIVVDKGEGIIDAFYFYFFAFNWGGVVLEKQLGDHVGDWEHNMIRFIAGKPKYIWLSQHANGEAFTFSAMKKDASGKRPICYIANGSHAIYPSPGTHDHTLPNFNLPTRLLLVDETDSGPLYDPILTSYVYTYNISTSTFTSSRDPIGFLNFTGHWGDAEYPADDARQKGKGLLGFKKYVGGPTGPGDKGLVRKEVWPESTLSWGQRIRTSVDETGWARKLDCFRVGQKMKMRQERKRGVTRVWVSGKGVV